MIYATAKRLSEVLSTTLLPLPFRYMADLNEVSYETVLKAALGY